MASQAISAFGTILSRGISGSPVSMIPIAEVRDIRGPGTSRTIIDVTHHESPGAWREKLAGLKNGGQVTMDLNALDDPTHDQVTGLIKAFEDGALDYYELVFPDAQVCAFSAIVQGEAFAAPLDDRLSASVTLEISGAVTWS